MPYGSYLYNEPSLEKTGKEWTFSEFLHYPCLLFLLFFARIGWLAAASVWGPAKPSPRHDKGVSVRGCCKANMAPIRGCEIERILLPWQALACSQVSLVVKESCVVLTRPLSNEIAAVLLFDPYAPVRKARRGSKTVFLTLQNAGRFQCGRCRADYCCRVLFPNMRWPVMLPADIAS